MGAAYCQQPHVVLVEKRLFLDKKREVSEEMPPRLSADYSTEVPPLLLPGKVALLSLEVRQQQLIQKRDSGKRDTPKLKLASLRERHGRKTVSISA